MTAVAAVALGIAIAFCFPARARLVPRGRVPGWLLPLLATGALPLLLRGSAMVGALVIAGFGVAAGWLVRRDRQRTRADETRRRVVEAAEALASELRAGQPPEPALERAAEVWPPLATVVAAARLGADVPEAFRHVGGQRGAEVLAQVASAWSLSHHIGSGLAQALDRVVEHARGELSTRRLIAAELASAQATARMVALMPVALLALSGGTGGDPWHFLLSTSPGVGCLAAGLSLVTVGLAWLDRIVVRVEASG